MLLQRFFRAANEDRASNRASKATAKGKQREVTCSPEVLDLATEL